MEQLLFILIGLTLLILGGNWLLRAAVALSLRLQIPKIVIGMTVVSLATSAPELIVSIRAALDGFPDLALGNVVGSNIANLGLVLAITILLGSITVRPSFYTTDWPMLMVASLLFAAFIWYDGVLGRLEGGVMVLMLVFFLWFLLLYQKPAVLEEAGLEVNPMGLPRLSVFLVAGGLALWGGSELLISGAVGLASKWGVSERVIGITLVSVGTSIPELAASVIAILKKEKAISLGNLVGSNIFNILAVLGITALITPVRAMDQRLISYDLFWMLGFAILILPLVFFPKGLRLGWRDGMLLILLYSIFVFTTLS